MKEIDISELKSIQLEILKYIKKVCDENNLKYYLCGGTLLGAIRHKGYIPWDDDIDIFMPIDDYKKFLAIAHENNGYTLLNPYNHDDYYYLFSKLVDNRTKLIEFGRVKIENMGVFVDIFPLFALPDDTKEREDFINKIIDLKTKHFRYFKTSWNYSNNKYKMIVKTIAKFPAYLLYKRKNIKDEILQMMEKYSYEDSKYVGFLLSAYSPDNEITRKEVYRETIQVEFEGDLFSAAIGYDEYLSNLYGDYMELPPVDKRVTHHNFIAFYKE